MPEQHSWSWAELRQHPGSTLKALGRSWLTVSTLAGLVATVFDLTLVVTLVQVAHFNPAVAAPIGVTLGAIVNFAINKRFAFQEARGSAVRQFAVFLGGTAVEAALHAGIVHVLTNKLGVFYVISKLIADVLVFTVGNLILLRFFVFPGDRKAPPRAVPLDS